MIGASRLSRLGQSHKRGAVVEGLKNHYASFNFGVDCLSDPLTAFAVLCREQFAENHERQRVGPDRHRNPV